MSLNEAHGALNRSKEELRDAAENTRAAAGHVKSISKFSWRLLGKLQRARMPENFEENLDRLSILAASARQKCEQAYGSLEEQLGLAADAGNENAAAALHHTNLSIESLGEGSGGPVEQPFVQTAVDLLREDMAAVRELMGQLEDRLSSMSHNASTLHETLHGIGGYTAGQTVEHLESYAYGIPNATVANFGRLGALPEAVLAITEYQRRLGR